jgi:hypothetical protein
MTDGTQMPRILWDRESLGLWSATEVSLSIPESPFLS